MAGISLNAIVGDNGIINKANKAKDETEKSQAMEKLEIELVNLGIAKDVDESYNSDDYIDEKLLAKNMTVMGDMVFVDNWLFKINREVPEISECLGNGQIDDKITINLISNVNKDFSKAVITGKIFCDNEVEYVMVNGEKVDFNDTGGGSYDINQSISKNGIVSVFVCGKGRKVSNKKHYCRWYNRRYGYLQ